MNAFIAPECLIMNAKVHKVITVILHALQVTQAISLLEAKHKWIFYISCDQFTPSMAIVFSIHALHLGRFVNIRMDGQQFKQDIPI
jgi:hypothetical protein